MKKRPLLMICSSVCESKAAVKSINSHAPAQTDAVRLTGRERERESQRKKKRLKKGGRKFTVVLSLSLSVVCVKENVW